jgi:hypothetical protein
MLSADKKVEVLASISYVRSLARVVLRLGIAELISQRIVSSRSTGHETN